MSDAHWATMVEKYSTEQAKKKSAKAAKSRKSAPVGKKMHKHGAGPRCFLNIAYQMVSFAFFFFIIYFALSVV